jgi:hypothetical protein
MWLLLQPVIEVAYARAGRISDAATGASTTSSRLKPGIPSLLPSSVEGALNGSEWTYGPEPL